MQGEAASAMLVGLRVQLQCRPSPNEPATPAACGLAAYQAALTLRHGTHLCGCGSLHSAAPAQRRCMQKPLPRRCMKGSALRGGPPESWRQPHCCQGYRALHVLETNLKQRLGCILVPEHQKQGRVQLQVAAPKVAETLSCADKVAEKGWARVRFSICSPLNISTALQQQISLSASKTRHARAQTQSLLRLKVPSSIPSLQQGCSQSWRCGCRAPQG